MPTAHAFEDDVALTAVNTLFAGSDLLILVHDLPFQRIISGFSIAPRCRKLLPTAHALRDEVTVTELR
jgi:hypothetical protein